MGSQRCPVPAIRYSGVELLSEANAGVHCLSVRVMRAGPCAAETHESRQVRKEAAVSGSFRVP